VVPIAVPGNPEPKRVPVVAVHFDGIVLPGPTAERVLAPLRQGLAPFSSAIDHVDVEITRVGTTRDGSGRLFRIEVTLDSGVVVHSVAIDSRLVEGLERAAERVMARIDDALARGSS
jgi:hypothetical protein